MRRLAARSAIIIASVCLAIPLALPMGALAASPPLAFDGSDQTRVDVPLDIFLDAFDPDDDPLTFAIVNPPTHGDLDDCTSGACVYTPDAGYIGGDTFTWKANDGAADSNTATFTIEVVANSAPEVFDQETQTRLDTPLDVVLDAFDIDDDPLIFTILGAPAHGDLDDCSAGACTYTPDPGYLGPDGFTWNANDGIADSTTAKFTIDVVVNSAPQALDQSDQTEVDSPLFVFLDATDAENDDLTFAIVTPPSHGNLDDCSAGDCTYTPDNGYVGPDIFTWKANDGIVDTNVATFSISVTPGPVAIVTSGPLTRIQTSVDLNCSVDHIGDSNPEFFGATACGTLLVVDGVLYGPASIPAGGAASPLTPWTFVDQSALTGAGTSQNPWKIVSVVAAGTTGVQVTQTDSYVTGSESYRTDIAISDSSGAVHQLRLYRAGDCFLQESDQGFGILDPATGAVSCRSGEISGGGTVPGPRVIQWFPLSPGSHAYEAGFNQVWSRIGDQLAFPDTCLCDQFLDNGAGLSWDIALAANGTATRSHLTTFSPLGRVPLTTAKTADDASTDLGGTNGYTITVDNPNDGSAVLQSITDQLPPGFAYVPGTTTGATTDDPSITGDALTWTGTFPVGAQGSASIHFDVTVADTAGTYFNEAGADGGTDPVIPTGPTAPISVEEGTNTPPTVDAGSDASAAEGASVGLSGSVVDPDDVPTLAWSASPGIDVDGGASCTFDAPTAAVTNVACSDDGTWTLTLTADDGTNPPVADSLVLSLTNADPVVDAGADQSVADGALVALDPATFSDAGTTDSHTATIDWGDGTSESGSVGGTAAAGTVSGSHTYGGPDTYTVTVTVTDDDTGSGSDTFEVTVGATSDTPPTVDAGSDASAAEGASVGLSGSVVDPDDVPTLAWSASPGIDVDGGASCTFDAPTAAVTNVACSDDGTWTLTLTADDGTNPPVADSLVLSLTNADPVVDAGADQSVADGALVALDPATFSDAGTTDSHTATIDWGDGTSESGSVGGTAAAGTVSGSHTYGGPDTYTVTVTVTDDDTGSGSDTFEVTVGATSDTPPTVDAGSDASAAEGASVGLSGSVVDPDDVPTLAWSASPGIDVDGGASCTFDAPTAAVTNVACSDDGTWTLTLTADDGTNPPVADSLVLSLTNADPVVDAGADQSVADGALVALDPATFSDAGTTDSHTATIDWGDGTSESGSVGGTAAAGTVSGSHTYGGPDTYTVTVTVTDDDTGSGSDTFEVTVEEPAPATADLGLTMSDTPDPVSSARDVRYTLTVTNGGPDDATGVTVEDTLPVVATFVSADSADGTCSVEGGVVSCDLGNVSTEDVVTIDIVVTAPDATIGTAITNEAAVAGDQDDPNPGNDSATESTTVRVPAADPDVASGWITTAGGSVQTGGGQGPSKKDPMTTTVTVPPGFEGVVTIEETAITSCPAGFSCFGQQANIVAPTTTAASPLHIVFLYHQSAIKPGGTKPAEIVMFHDDVVVPRCSTSSGTADPDPCILSAQKVQGNVRVEVLSSHNGSWKGGR